jgi:hypothetical protein
MGCWKKLKFWRRAKKYVIADSHEQTEKRLRDMETALTALQEKMEHRYSVNSYSSSHHTTLV